MHNKHLFHAGLILAMCAALAPTAGAQGSNEAEYKQVAQLWKRSCVACHNSKKAEGGLNLESAATLMKGGDSGAAVVAGKSGESELLKRITATDDTIMPPRDNATGAKPLAPAEIELVKKWIDAGAVPGDDGLPMTIAWQPVPGNFQPIYALDASADGQFVASGRGNQVVLYSWPLQSSASSAIALIDPQTIRSAGAPAAHLDLVQSIAFSPDAQLLATGGYRCVKLWKRDLVPTSLVGLKNCTGVAAASNNGLLWAMARDDKSIDVVDAGNRQVVVKIPASSVAATCLAWSPDDQYLFVGSADNSVSRWAVALAGAAPVTASQPLTFSAQAAVSQLAPLAGDRLAALLADGQVGLWVAEAPAEPANAPIAIVKKEFAEAIPAAISIAALAGQPAKLIVAHADGTIRSVHGVETKALATWKSPVSITRLAAHPKVAQVASLGNDGSLRIWNAADGKEIANVVPETAIARDAAKSSRTAARQSAEVDRLAATIKELETAHQKEQEAMKKVSEERDKAAAALAAKVAEVDANTNAIKEAEKGIESAKAMIAEQMKRIETLTADIEAKKKKDGELVAAKNTAMEGVQKQEQALAAAKDAVQRAANAVPAQQAVVESAKTQLTALQSAAAAVAEQAKLAREEQPASFGFDSTGNQILIGSKPGHVTVLNVASGRVALEAQAAPGLTSVLSNGRTTVVASASAPPSAWNTDGSWKLDRIVGSETDSASPLSDRITALAFSPDGQTLAIGSGPASRFGDVKLVRVADGAIVKDLGEVHSDTVLDMAFSPDGSQLATCGADKLVRVFDLATGKQRLGLEGHTHHVLSIAWQDSGNALASGSADGTVKVWNLITGEQQRTVAGFAKEVTSLSYVGQTTQFLATCADNSLRLVEANNGQTVRSFAGSSSALYAMCLSPDNKHVLAGGQDGKLIIWTVENGQVAKQLD